MSAVFTWAEDSDILGPLLVRRPCCCLYFGRARAGSVTQHYSPEIGAMHLVVDFVTSNQGDRKDSTPGLTISEPASFPLRRGNRLPLYSLCALDGPSAAEVTPVVCEALHAEFARAAGRSVTSALMRASRTALDTLTRENARSLHQHRCAASLCATALKGDVLYLAACGGAVAYTWKSRETKVVCASEAGTANAFGEESEIALGSVRLDPGAAVILASRGAAQMFEAAGAADRLARVEHVDRIAETIEGILFSSSRGNEFSVAILAGPPLSVESMPSAPIASTSPDREQPKTQESRAFGSSARNGDQPPTVSGRAAPELAAKIKKETVAAPTRPAAKPVDVRRSTYQAGPVRAVLSSLQRVLLRFSVVAVVLAVVAVALYLGEGYFSTQARQVQAAEILANLEQKERDAAAAADPATRRWLLTEASRAADRALAESNPGEEVVAAARRIQVALDDLNGIVRLSSLQLLADFASLDPAAKPTAILAAKDDLYVLDRGLGSVWYLRLGLDLGTTGKPALIWEKSQADQKESLREAVDFFWMHGAAPGIPEQLYVLNSDGALVPCNQTQTGEIKRVPAAGALAKVQAAAGQAGNLYVLDNQRRVVWRYVPGPNGYEGVGQEYLNDSAAPELADAVDMAMDGSLYFLLSDGRIVKYSGGQAQPFAAVVPDAPLRKPTAVFTSPTTRYVYVADSGNSRVVQFTKEGQYVRQMRAPDGTMESLRAAFVDEGSRRLYTVAGTRAFVAELPGEGKQ